jgi:hypothetical protein
MKQPNSEVYKLLAYMLLLIGLLVMPLGCSGGEQGQAGEIGSSLA